MPLYRVVLTIRSRIGAAQSYETQQRAANDIRAKWAVLRRWGSKPEVQDTDLLQLELSAVKLRE